MRVIVYVYGDDVNALSSHAHVSKSTAVRWVSWGTHAWVDRHTIQERYPEPFRSIPGRVLPALITRYSPDQLPPLEVAQVHFEEPKSTAWRLAHRSVKFPERPCHHGQEAHEQQDFTGVEARIPHSKSNLTLD